MRSNVNWGRPRSSLLRAPHSAFDLGVIQMSFRSRLTFRGITLAIFKVLRKKAAQNGIPISSQAGEAIKDGIKIQWKYDPDAQLLEVGCVQAPFWISAGRINRRLSEEIEATLESRSAA